MFFRGRTEVLLSAVKLQYLGELVGALLAANQDLTAAPWPPNTVLCNEFHSHRCRSASTAVSHSNQNLV